ncbi:MAG: PDC sensor domain-containing protein [Deltaproteobacteria bacterium]
MAVSGQTPRLDVSRRNRAQTVLNGSRWHRQRRLWFPLIIAMVLVLVGLGSHITVEKAMKDMLAAKLETILAADVTGLVIWLDSQERMVEEVVQEPEIASAIRDLARASNSGKPTSKFLKNLPAFQEIRKILRTVCRRHGYADFLVINPKGIIVASDEEAYLERPFAPNHPDIAKQILSGQPMITRPFRTTLPIPDDQGNLKSDQPIIIAAACVYGPEGTIAAALAFMIRPERDFTGILTKGRPGKSGETYAFNANGKMISQSRVEDQLRSIGLLAEDPHVCSILNVEIKNPGGNLLEGFRPRRRSEQPLTLMASSAVAGNDGINVDGYRDYRGVPVIGAWVWLNRCRLLGTACHASSSHRLKNSAA